MYDPYAKQNQQPVIPVAVPIPVGGKMDYAAPVQQVMGGPLEILAGRDKILVKQRFEKLEALAGAIGFGAVEFSNKYEVFDGTTGEKLLDAVEESNCFIRACCKPNHNLKMHIYEGREGRGHEEIMTMDKPFKLCCCAFCNICAQEQTMLIGEEKVGSSKKDTPCGGGFSPLFNIKDKSDEVKFKLKGPCCIVGGLIEFCTEQQFDIVDSTDISQGRIKHLKPGSGMEGLIEFAGDADRLLLELNDTSKMDPEMAANLLATVLLMDFAFYENGSAFSCDPFRQTCHINCCNLYCLGCLCPCTLTLGGGGGDGGDDGGDGGGE